MDKIFEWFDSKTIGNRKKACADDREMIKECVLHSKCFEET